MSYRHCRPHLCAFALSCALLGCARAVAAPNEVENPVNLDAGTPPPMAADAVVPSEPPLVLFLLDSSASMDWIDDCTCTTPACRECLPDCASDRKLRRLRVRARAGRGRERARTAHPDHHAT